MRDKGQTVIIVIAFLTFLFIVGVAFFTLSQAERAASLRHLDGVRARYIAEAGVAYALQVLKLDRQVNVIDSFEDLSFKHFLGEEADLDADGKPESRWFNVTDSEGKVAGRFCVRVSDEASKINLNTIEGEKLEKLFSQLGIGESKAGSLLNRRPFSAVEQAGQVLGKDDFALARDFLTVYSRDWELNLDRERRFYLNSSSAQVIFEGFLNAGIRSPHQKAANLKDASDSGLCQTFLDEFIRSNIMPAQLQEAGSWANKGSFYEAYSSSPESGKFIWSNLPIEDGEYYCFLYGPENVLYYKGDIGEVYLDGEEDESELVSSGEGLTKKVTVSAGSLTLNIKPVKDKTCGFSYIELVSLEPKNGLSRKVITGTEAIVINEVIPKLSTQILMDTPQDIDPGQIFIHTFNNARAGNYYAVVLAKEAGGFVGDVTINGKMGDSLYDKDYLPATVNIGSEGTITLQIKNNSLGKAGFMGLIILQQPDAEFIELLNLSPEEIDLSDFSFEAYSSKDELIAGWPGRIPQGTKIAPYQHLAFSVDNSDSSPSPDLLKGNNISFQGVWGFNGVGLAFDEHLGTIDKSFDLLPDEGGRVILKDNLGRQVDGVEYLSPQVKEFISLERTDPSAKTDDDLDGFFDGWYPSENKNGATPSSANENSGMYTVNEDGSLLKHSPSEIVVYNRKLTDLSEALDLPEGRRWKKFGILDLSCIADRFAYNATELDLSGHYISGEFKEKDGVFESSHKQDAGVWEFTKIPKGSYLLSISSDNLSAEGEKILLSYKTDSKGDFKDYSSLLFVQGVAFYGKVEFKEDNSFFGLKIINDSEKKLAIDKVQLEPIDSVYGRININTAKEEALLGIISSESLVETILNNRPIGNKDNRKLGVGELFLLDSNFLSFHNSLTVKSDVFEIYSRGEYSPQEKTMAYQIIRTVLERGE